MTDAARPRAVRSQALNLVVRKDQVAPILTGLITQLRFAGYRWPESVRRGKSYAIRSKLGGPEIVRVEVAGRFYLPLSRATEDDAAREGHESLDAMWEAWKGKLPLSAPSWVLTFVLSPWDPSRYMAPGSGYTADRERALDPDAEVPPASWLLVEATRCRVGFMHERDAELAEILADCLSVEERIAALDREARRLGVDVRSERRLARDMLRRGKQPQRQEEAMAKKIRSRWAA